MSRYIVVQTCTIHGLLQRDGVIVDTNASSALYRVGATEARELEATGYLRCLDRNDFIVTASGTETAKQPPYEPGKWKQL